MQNTQCQISNLRSAVSNSLLVLVLGCAACSTEQAGTDWAGTVSDSAGVTFVRNSAQGLWTDADRWTVEQDLVIGATEGDPDYLFGHVAGVCVDSGGAIYVLDAGAVRVAVYGPDGVFRHSFGEPGQGPGQLTTFARPCLMGAGDTLYIPDLQNARLNRFASDGSFAGSDRIDPMQGFPVGWQMLDGGRMVQQMMFQGISQGPYPDSVQILVVRQPDGSVRDTLLEFPAGGTVVAMVGRTGGRGGTINFYAPEPSWAAMPDGSFSYGRNDQYRIEQYGAAGRLRRVITKPSETAPVSESDHEVLFEALGEMLRRRGMPEAMLEQMRQVIGFAESYPAYHRFMRGPQGTLWVQRVRQAGDMSSTERAVLSAALENIEGLLTDPHLPLGAPDWDVFDSEGRYLGVVTLPAGFTPLLLRDNAIYGTRLDELDVEYVVRLMIHGP